MADIIETYSTNVDITKANKTLNHTTTNSDDEIISSSEQSDVLQNEANDNTGDNNEHGLSSTSNNNNTNTNNASLSKNSELSSSNIYKDFSGIDTESFIMNTLRNNPKDRLLLLSIEKIFQEFILNKEQTTHQFQAMNSYERMIVHRVAAFFGLDHNVDKNGQSIIVTKTDNTRIPNISFENFIPIDEIPNGDTTTTTTTINPPDENSVRRIPHRNNKQTFNSTKSSFERTNNHNVEKIPNKFNRKQRFNTNQQTNFQTSSQFINPRAQPIYPSASNSYYPQQSIDHDFKQQTTGSSMYNYVPMISPTSYSQGNGISLPILLHQQPTGQIQYVFPSHTLQQQQQQQQQPTTTTLSSDGQYMQVYRSDLMPQVVDNNLYSQQPYVHLYPSHHYPHTQQATYIQQVPSFMIPPNNPTSIQYTTNQLASLNLQSQYDEARLSQLNNSIKTFSSNGLNSNSTYHHHHHHHHQQQQQQQQQQHRQKRLINQNHIDKQIQPIENDMKTTDPISLSGPEQEKD